MIFCSVIVIFTNLDGVVSVLLPCTKVITLDFRENTAHQSSHTAVLLYGHPAQGFVVVEGDRLVVVLVFVVVESV